MRRKSLGVNTILYTIKIVVSMLFSLITIPYVSRILSASGVGEYNFSNAFVSYFMLIAGLGTSTYAIKEGGKIRDNKMEMQHFAQDIFSISFFATGISVLLLLIAVCIFPALNPYKQTIMILSSSIPLTMLGTEWIFNIYEDFVYITIRSILFQFVSILLILVFVQRTTDVWKYAIITVIASTGTNILNFKHAKKYFSHKIRFTKSVMRHLKPILILFASAVASQIYINSDITMLGLMQGSYATGIYSSATKIYDMVRTLMMVVITIVLPRLSYLNKKETRIDYVVLLNKVINLYMCIITPAAIGLMCVSKNVIMLLLGAEYVESIAVLKLLCIALLFSSLGSLVANTILVVHSKEKKILLATCIGAIFNITTNLFFIPRYSYIGAAITTVLSEIIVFLIQSLFAMGCVRIQGTLSNIVKIAIGIICMLCVYQTITEIHLGEVFGLILIILLCGITYMSVMVVLRQETIYEYVNKIIRKLTVLSKVKR